MPDVLHDLKSLADQLGVERGTSGSSGGMISDPSQRARQSLTRCCWPPGSSGVVVRAIRQPHQTEQLKSLGLLLRTPEPVPRLDVLRAVMCGRD